MAQQLFVVRHSTADDLYMLNPYSPVYSQNTWGAISNPNLMTRLTLAEVQAMAATINSGTVGLPRPS
jgi:hypothetical protein